MMYVLNSDTVKYVLQQRGPVYSRYQMAQKDGATFALCPIVQFELSRIPKLKRATNIETNFSDLIRRWQRIEYAAEDWDLLSSVWADSNRAATVLSDSDVFIALTAFKTGATLVTCNPKPFVGLGIPLENWLTG